MPWEVAQILKSGTGEKADGHENNPEHLRRAEEVYRWMAGVNPYDVIIECAPDRTLGSLKKPEEIHEEVYSIILETINWKKGKGNLTPLR